MARVSGTVGDQFYLAAQRFVDAALRADDSLFTPGRPVWTLVNIEDLYRRFAEELDTSNDSFENKFRRELQGASPEVYQLAGEMIYVHLLIAAGTIGYEAKRGLITRVLSWSPAPQDIPADFDQALRQGLARVGTAFLTYRPFQLGFLLQFVRHWKRLPVAERDAALADPWAFKRILFGLPISRAYAQREALLHIVHPDTFEPIVSRDHKARFARQWAEYAAEQSDDVDRMLLAIRQGYQQRHGAPIDFYQTGPETGGPASGDTSPLPRTLGARLRPYVELITHLPASGYTPAEIVDRLGQIRPPLASELTYRPDPDALVRDLVNLRLLKTTPGSYRRWTHLDDATVDHILRYAALTLLVPKDDGGYDLPALRAPFDGQPHPPDDWPYGTALLAWYHEAGLVTQTDEGTWQSVSDALEPLNAQTSSATALNTFLAHLRRVRERRADLPPIADEPLPLLDPTTLETRIAEIQRELLVDRMTILRIYRALIAGQHVILSGPPGTGKTHLATLLPRVLWRDAEATRVLDMPIDPSLPPTEPPTERLLERQGYDVTVTTATEDWGVRQVIGGIVPQLVRNGEQRTLVYRVRYGCLTQTVLANYAGHDSEEIPPPAALVRQEVRDTAGRRYRGRWLVIDEFTRAPIDAAFGSLLTTLGGQRSPLMVPTDDGREAPLQLPRDFRIIGTLNSFDRHFLNQISEAMKRRFTFIDILPPARDLHEYEMGIAVHRALTRLGGQETLDIDSGEVPNSLVWEDIMRVSPTDAGNAQFHLRYQVSYDDEEAGATVADFWRIFRAIRVYRQLGTAQAETVLATLFSGHSVGLTWADALDSALADVLADQLQVLSRDEQAVLLAYLAHAGDATAFVKRVLEVLADNSDTRQSAHLNTLQLAGATTKGASVTERRASLDLSGAFVLGAALLIPPDGLFGRRLQAYVDERGL
jgi:5-methylcytosine-specific restriction enzyme B